MRLRLPVGMLTSSNRVITLSFSPNLVLPAPYPPSSTTPSSCHSSRPASHCGRHAAPSHSSPACCTTPSTGHATGLASAQREFRRTQPPASGASPAPPRPLQQGVAVGGRAEQRPADGHGLHGAAQATEMLCAGHSAAQSDVCGFADRGPESGPIAQAAGGLWPQGRALSRPGTVRRGTAEAGCLSQFCGQRLPSRPGTAASAQRAASGCSVGERRRGKCAMPPSSMACSHVCLAVSCNATEAPGCCLPYAPVLACMQTLCVHALPMPWILSSA